MEHSARTCNIFPVWIKEFAHRNWSWLNHFRKKMTNSVLFGSGLSIGANLILPSSFRGIAVSLHADRAGSTHYNKCKHWFRLKLALIAFISHNNFSVFLVKWVIRMVHVKNYETVSKFLKLCAENCSPDTIKPAISPKRCKIGPRLLWRTNRNSHTHFDWCQNQWPWMTLNGRNVSLAEIKYFYRARDNNFNAITISCYQRQNVDLWF